MFQTNPRGVGGTKVRGHPRLTNCFRPTLVGSEAFQRVGGEVVVVVSDQPSWGRRHCLRRLKLVLRLVSDQPSWGRRRLTSLRRAVHAGFRPTLVGSEVSVGFDCLAIEGRVSDQPSWGRRAIHATDQAQIGDGFRPTLVGSEESQCRTRLRQTKCFRPTLVGSEGGHHAVLP